jgi:hypothetical protein
MFGMLLNLTLAERILTHNIIILLLQIFLRLLEEILEPLPIHILELEAHQLQEIMLQQQLGDHTVTRLLYNKESKKGIRENDDEEK